MVLYRRVSGCPRRRPGRCSSARCRWRWDASEPEDLWSATDRERDRSHEPPPGPGRSATPLQSHMITPAPPAATHEHHDSQEQHRTSNTPACTAACSSPFTYTAVQLPCFQLNLDLPRIQNSWLSKWISPRGGRKA